jgi:hypothetical protein
MTETRDYPVATLHAFLDEMSREFRRYRLQAKLTLVGSVFLFFFLARFAFLLYETAPLRSLMQVPLIIDGILLVVALTVVLLSLDVWRHQRKFISRWGTRFEKLQVMEKQLLPEEQS